MEIRWYDGLSYLRGKGQEKQGPGQEQAKSMAGQVRGRDRSGVGNVRDWAGEDTESRDDQVRDKIMERHTVVSCRVVYIEQCPYHVITPISSIL